MTTITRKYIRSAQFHALNAGPEFLNAQGLFGFEQRDRKFFYKSRMEKNTKIKISSFVGTQVVLESTQLQIQEVITRN
jgi:hypothetical protein